MGATLSPQLHQIAEELHAATQRADALITKTPAQVWAQPPPAGGWSIGECYVHLNLSSKAFLPRLLEALHNARKEKRRASGEFALDLPGRMLLWFIEPPYRMKFKTPEAFHAPSVPPAAEVMKEWRRLQHDLLDCLSQAEGLAIDQVKIASPFAEKLRYSVYSSFRVIPAHQRRHLWQAEQIRKMLGN